MEGILLLAHGSRAQETLQTMEKVAQMVRRRLPGSLIQVAYMEFCEVNIEKGLALLMEQGATTVKVIPYFLFEGIHIREDIPAQLAAFQEKHPHITIHMGKAIGADERLAEIIAERILA